MDAARFVLYTLQVNLIVRMGTASLASVFCIWGQRHLYSLQFVQLRPRTCSLSSWVFVCFFFLFPTTFKFYVQFP